MTTVAIMQPYFFPYGGYYRLLAAADIFVILDDVQFPRRGRVHRSALSGDGRWITLPLVAAPRDSLICEMRLAGDAAERLRPQFRKLPVAMRTDTPLRRRIAELLESPEGALVPFLAETLRITAESLGFDCRICRSSHLHVPQGLPAQERIIEIVRSLGGDRYINAPGGTALYDRASFLRSGIELAFLTDYAGLHRHFFPAIFEADTAELRADIMETCAFRPPPDDDAATGRSGVMHE